MLGHVRYALPAGLAVGLAVAGLDAGLLGLRGIGWLAFAFLAYGLAIAAGLVVVAVIVGAVCGVVGYRPGPWTRAVFYVGLPVLAMAAVGGGELFRRMVIPSFFKGTHEVAPMLAASLCGFVAGAAFVAILAATARHDAREGAASAGSGGGKRAPAGGARALVVSGIAMVGLATASALGLMVGEVTYGLRSVSGKNLVIICIDALRPDHLSCYGYERKTSPNIDLLAGSGARFERAICQSPGSTASHASIMTSLYPLTHGAWNVGDSLHEDVPSLQKHLRDRGYTTAFFGNNYFLSPRFGFTTGFDTFGNEELAYKVKGASLGLYPRSLGAARLFRTWRVKPGAPSEFSIDQALSWMEKNRKRKFFVFLHIMDPHAPYSPPGDYRHAFFSRDYPGELRDGKKLRGRIDALEPWEEDQLVDLYDGEIAYADSKVGRLVEALRTWGIDEKTVVVITADHGEVLKEHGGIFNHGYLWDYCTRVPLIVNLPPSIPAGVSRGQVVQSIDIAPTALSLLGESPLEQAQGVDLTAVIRDSSSTMGLAYTLGGITKGEGYSLTGSRWKLAWIDEDHVELYDLESDPGETRNLVDERSEVVSELKKRLLLWVEESAAAAMVPRSETVDLERLEDEVQERLRTLGYIK